MVGLLDAFLTMSVSFWMLLKWPTYRQMQCPLQRLQRRYPAEASTDH
jgi:hypothetical protein